LRARKGARSLAAHDDEGWVAKQGEHDKLIAAAAKEMLAPLGYRRKGRSRLWLADRGYWLSIVEFQPSGWSKGSYLNVAAHWLWSPGSDLSFNYLEQISPHIEFVDGAQFEPLARELARQAAETSVRYARQFGSIEAIADTLEATLEAGEKLLEAHGLRERGRKAPGGWAAFDLAVAAALAGRQDLARDHFRSAQEGAAGTLLDETARIFEAKSEDGGEFREHIQRCVDARRSVYGLAPIAAVILD
jgi:hypothetical protein